MTNFRAIKYKGQSVACYGPPLSETDAIVMCYEWEGMGLDDIVENWNYDTKDSFANWREAVKYLIDLNRFGEIVELQSDS